MKNQTYHRGTLEKLSDETSLLERLVRDVVECYKEKIVLLAGHFPLLYTKEGAIEAIKMWGEFSTYSLELACKIGKYARDNGKRVNFVFFVDDHAYESFTQLSSHQIKKMRNRLYKERSGGDARLVQEYQAIMSKYGFNESQVLRHNHNKKGREDCLYFSEKILRSSDLKIDNVCAREYTEFIENPSYFDKTGSHIIAFVPNRCQTHICDVALDTEIQGLSASHTFIETMTPLASRNELYSLGRGITYRRDN